MGKLIDITGQRFGRLTVLYRDGSYICETLHPDGEKFIFTAQMWRCRCDCGNEVTVLGASMRNGNTRSCGCYRRDRRRRHE